MSLKDTYISNKEVIVLYFERFNRVEISLSDCTNGILAATVCRTGTGNIIKYNILKYDHNMYELDDKVQIIKYKNDKNIYILAL